MKHLKTTIFEDYVSNRIFFLTILLPVSLIPAFLVTGPFLPDLSISIAAIFICYQILYKKKYHYLNFIPVYIFFLFCFYILITSFFATDIYLSLTETLFYCRFGFFSIFIYYILKNNKNFIYYFTIFFIITFLIVYIDSYFQYFFKFNITGNAYNGFRLNSFFGSELKLGSFIVRLTPILIGLILYNFKDSNFIRFFLIFILINSFIIALLSGERVAFFLLLLYLLGFFVLTNIRLNYKIITILIILPVISFITISNKEVRHRMIDSTINQLFDKNNLNYFYISRSHSGTFITAFNMFLDKPYIGVGVKNFRVLCNENKYWNKSNKILKNADGSTIKNEYGCFTHPHNNYIQLLAETGLIGFLIIFIFFIMILYILIKHFFFLFIPRKKNKLLANYQISFYLAILITLLPLIPSGNFFNNWLSAIYFMPVGFTLYFHSINK